jgi:hypothetical protein
VELACAALADGWVTSDDGVVVGWVTSDDGVVVGWVTSDEDCDDIGSPGEEDIELLVFTPFVSDDVLLELSAKESEKAYCGKIKIAESKRGIKNFVFISPSHQY